MSIAAPICPLKSGGKSPPAFIIHSSCGGKAGAPHKNPISANASGLIKPRTNVAVKLADLLAVAEVADGNPAMRACPVVTVAIKSRRRRRRQLRREARADD